MASRICEPQHQATPRMAVPKTAVDEHHFPPLGENHVGPSGQTTPMQPISVAHPMNKATDGQFWLRVLSLDARHPLTAFPRGQCVHFRSIRPWLEARGDCNASADCGLCPLCGEPSSVGSHAQCRASSPHPLVAAAPNRRQFHRAPFRGATTQLPKRRSRPAVKASRRSFGTIPGPLLRDPVRLAAPLSSSEMPYRRGVTSPCHRP